MSEKDTVVLSSSDLKYLLLDNLKEYSEAVAFLYGTNPYAIQVNKKNFHILIKNTHSSGRGRDNPDECRIQISRETVLQHLRNKSSFTAAVFLGYLKDCKVFTAWNPKVLVDRLSASPITSGNISVYSRFSIQEKAAKEGIACYTDYNSQRIISFQPKLIGLYLQNLEAMHRVSEASLQELARVVDSVADGEKVVELERERFLITREAYRRDPAFRDRVLKAYGYRCAICGIQLELVEAAHIVPHSHEKGTDEVGNGVCLCVLHHKAYDNGFIFFDESYHVYVNDEKEAYYTKTKQDGGLSVFKKSILLEELSVPENKLHWPNPAFVTQANGIRGISS